MKPAYSFSGPRGTAAEIDCAPPSWPAPLGADAFHGLAGCFIRLTEPYSEADPAPLLVQLLVGFGNLVGRGPHFIAGSDLHFTNNFVAVLGQTSKARKGMSWSLVKHVLSRAEPRWAKDHIKSGLASGEGLIAALKDGGDKRLLIYEPEFSRVLKATDRKDSTLSDIIRQAWDGTDLAVLTRQNPLLVREPMISMVAHITIEEIRALLSDLTMLNGFANRFLWVCASRSKSLPDGAPVPQEDIDELAGLLKERLEFAHRVGLLAREEEARELWHQEYKQLSEGESGLFGAATARAEAHVMRIACTYALLDGVAEICVEHLRASLAVYAPLAN